MIPISEVLARAGEYFMGQSPVQHAAERIAAALRDLNIPFAVAGALAVNAHGHVRMTDDVDLLMTPEGLAQFKSRWLGRGWVEKFPGSRGVRDAIHDVKIDVLLTGEFPGDGKPKPVPFPHPEAAAAPGTAGWPVVSLAVLLELKLASGMTAPHRLQDLSDVIQLIRVNHLALDYADRLHPYVQAKFRELWPSAQIREDF